MNSLEAVLDADGEARALAPRRSRAVPQVRAPRHEPVLDTPAGLHRRRVPAGHGARIRHYWVAAPAGFKVLRFSVGFGKTLWSRVAGADRTEYVIAAVPLGGYVKMLDEREGPVAPAELARSFTRRPHWQRIAVLLAGPAFNILFAVLLLTGMLLVSGITEVRPVLGTIDATSIAGRAGLKAGDEVVQIDSRAVASQRDVLFGLLDAVSSRRRSRCRCAPAMARCAPRRCRSPMPPSACT